ncbi:MAG: hypothetical protein ABEI06_02400 [Halobacteriaceae archaeon]
MGDSTEDSEQSPSKDNESSKNIQRQVEEQYDFDSFGPADMKEMSAEEWEAAFDPDTWITGQKLIDRVEQDLRSRIKDGDVFAVLEREEYDDEQCLLAYSDRGYAIVYPDGTIEGQGTVLRDVKPSVALCSMDSYDVPDVSEDVSLPSPEDIESSGRDLGNLVLQVVGAVQLLASVILFFSWIAFSLSVIVPVVAFGFFLFGVFLLVVVANARLSGRFRADDFRQRLEEAGVNGERPEFVPNEVDKEQPEDRT